MEPSSASISSGNGSQRLGQNLRHMVDEIDTFLKSAAASGDRRFDEVREKLVGQVQEMRSQLDTLEAAALDRARRAAKLADEKVHAHPYGAMGLSAAVGLLLGFLAARR